MSKCKHCGSDTPEKIARPKKLQNPNFKALQELCQEYMDFVDSDDYCDDNDYSQYLYEAAIEAMYGDKVWEWLNSRLE